MAVYFEPISTLDWDMFREVKEIGHIEPVLGTESMETGDVVLLYVGKQNPKIQSGVYAYGTIICEPYIYKENPKDHCYEKTVVNVRIDYIDYRNPIISESDMKIYNKQFRVPHLLNGLYADEILEHIKYTYTPIEKSSKGYIIDEERFTCAIKIWKQAISATPQQAGKEIRFDNGFIKATEYYKYDIYQKCRDFLNTDIWTESMIGTGEISERVIAVFGKAGNLIDYRTNTISERIRKNISKSDKIFFDLYCGDDDEKAFEDVTELVGKLYDKISFLFFLKDREKYFPVKPTFFAEYLKIMGIDSGCMNGLSWKHITEFAEILQDIRLRIRPYFNGAITMLDTHSFVWCMYLVEKQLNNINLEYRDYADGMIQITKEMWMEMLSNQDIFREKEISILVRIYLSPNQASTCKALAREDNVHTTVYVSNMVSLARRVMKYLNLEPLKRPNDERMWWPVLFLGRNLPSGLFEWKIRPELAAAMCEVLLEELTIKQEENEVARSSNEELYKKAISVPKKPMKSDRSSVVKYIRNPAIAEYAKRTAEGICQLCGEYAPFNDTKGNPYLESHHIVWLSEGGEDSIKNVVALCPNCHKKMHIVNDQEDRSLLQDIADGYCNEWKDCFS